MKSKKDRILEKSYYAAIEMSFSSKKWTKEEIMKEVADVLANEYDYFICPQKWKFFDSKTFKTKDDAVKFLYKKRKLYENYNLAVCYMSNNGLYWYVKSE